MRGTPAKAKLESNTSAIALIWVAHPMPNDAIIAKRANATAIFFIFKPLSRAYIAPPNILPSFDWTLYFTLINDSAYFVAIPNTPVIQHQKTAPGPPKYTAVPTPMILPVPIVEARAVVNAWNWLTSPAELSSFVMESFMPNGTFLWINPVLYVR